MAEISQARTTVYRGRSVTVVYQTNRAGIAECAVGPELRHAVGDIAERRARPYAISISPVETGEYVSSWRVENDHYTTIRDMRRVAAWLVNFSDHAVYVEVGTGTNPAHHVLSKTLGYLNASGEAFDVAEHL